MPTAMFPRSPAVGRVGPAGDKDRTVRISRDVFGYRIQGLPLGPVLMPNSGRPPVVSEPAASPSLGSSINLMCFGHLNLEDVGQRHSRPARRSPSHPAAFSDRRILYSWEFWRKVAAARSGTTTRWRGGPSCSTTIAVRRHPPRIHRGLPPCLSHPTRESCGGPKLSMFGRLVW